MRIFTFVVALLAISLALAVHADASRTVTTLLTIPLGALLGFAGSYRVVAALMEPRAHRPASMRRVGPSPVRKPSRVVVLHAVRTPVTQTRLRIAA